MTAAAPPPQGSCPGASPARVGTALFPRFPGRFPGSGVPEQSPAYLPNFTLRGLRALRLNLA